MINIIVTQLRISSITFYNNVEEKNKKKHKIKVKFKVLVIFSFMENKRTKNRSGHHKNVQLCVFCCVVNTNISLLLVVCVKWVKYCQ